MWSCQDNLPASGGEWTAVSRCTRPSSLSAGKSLQMHGALLLWLVHVGHNFMEMVCKKHLCSAFFFSWVSCRDLVQQGQVQNYWGRGRFWDFAVKVLEKLRKVFQKLTKTTESSSRLKRLFLKKLAYVFITSLHLYLQRENPSVLKDYVIKMLVGLTMDYLHVSIVMSLSRALHYSF